jgi:hypothetical protein
MDEEAVKVLARFVWILQRRGVANSRMNAYEAAFSVYSIVAFTFMELLFLEAGKKEEFLSKLDERLTILIEGLGRRESPG